MVSYDKLLGKTLLHKHKESDISDLGDYVLTTGDTMTGTDSTTFFQIQKNDTTPVLTVDTTNGRIAVGVDETPAGMIEISNNGESSGFFTSYDSSKSSQFVFRRCIGTFISPIAVGSGNTIATISARAMQDDGSFSGSIAQIRVSADENITTTAHGSTIRFLTTDNGTTTLDERIRVNHNGRVGIGLTNPGYELDVSGDINCSGAFRSGGTSGVSGSFTSVDLKTVIVTNGIITAIV